MGVTGGGRPQLGLFRGGPSPAPADPDPARSLHRRSDSAGSREAARYRAAAEGRHDRTAAVLEALRRRPWQTSRELFADEAEFLTGAGVLDRTDLARRLPILLRRELVSRIDPDRYPTVRPCRETGTRCHRWALAGEAGAEDWLEARVSSRPRTRGRRAISPARTGPAVGQGPRVGCDRCEWQGWLLGKDGVARPCACRR